MSVEKLTILVFKEVMTGKLPYFSYNSDMGVIKAIWDGVTPAPEDYAELPASDPLWGIMRECWEEDRSMRPTMEQLITKVCGLFSEFNLELRTSLSS